MVSTRELRQALHRHPELSGGEHQSARLVAEFMAPLRPDATVTGLGGTSLAFAFGAAAHGPTVLLRCELDAVPVTEAAASGPAVGFGNAAHRCGHDGHMAIMAAVAQSLAAQRPRRGRVVLLFQSAEETGVGAAAVIADPRFGPLHPDWVFALHNLPGYQLGAVVVRDGTFSCASRGMVVEFTGRAAHAAQPETGASPAAAMCQLIAAYDSLAAEFAGTGELAFATVVGARLGERAFGTAPALASVFATLRCESNQTMGRMSGHCEATARRLAGACGLGVKIAYEDVYDATGNDEQAVACIRRVAAPLELIEASEAFRWSEDFGRFTARWPGALFGVGAGAACAALHDATYQFPDELIAPAAALMVRIVADRLASGTE